MCIRDRVNFSFLPAAAPFWMFLAAAIATISPSPARGWLSLPRVRGRVGSGPDLKELSLPRPRGRVGVEVGAVLLVAVLASALAYFGVIRPYAADAALFTGLGAQADGRLADARTAVARARSLARDQTAYAVAAGNLALNLDSEDLPAADADWAAARDAYLEAAKLGTFSPDAFRHLALADVALGRRAEALAAARKAVELDRFDPENQRLLNQLTAHPYASGLDRVLTVSKLSLGEES